MTHVLIHTETGTIVDTDGLALLNINDIDEATNTPVETAEILPAIVIRATPVVVRDPNPDEVLVVDTVFGQVDLLFPEELKGAHIIDSDDNGRVAIRLANGEIVIGNSIDFD
jgi:hypothetical protein